MSALGQKRTIRPGPKLTIVRALVQKRNIRGYGPNVRFVPIDGVIGRRCCG